MERFEALPLLHLPVQRVGGHSNKSKHLYGRQCASESESVETK
jgi:hypothetical protein